MDRAGDGRGRVMAEADEMMDCASSSITSLDQVSWYCGAVGVGAEVSSSASSSEASQSSASVLWIHLRILRMLGLW